GRHGGLRFVLTATETAAALAAMAQGEITGRPGACLTTLGPGVASAVNGVACAWLHRAPPIVITHGHPASAASPFPHARLAHRALLLRVTKCSAAIEPETAADVIDRALAAAVAPPPGPVHLDMPADVSDRHAAAPAAAARHRPPDSSRAGDAAPAS